MSTYEKNVTICSLKKKSNSQNRITMLTNECKFKGITSHFIEKNRNCFNGDSALISFFHIIAMEAKVKPELAFCLCVHPNVASPQLFCGSYSFVFFVDNDFIGIPLPLSFHSISISQAVSPNLKSATTCTPCCFLPSDSCNHCWAIKNGTGAGNLTTLSIYSKQKNVLNAKQKCATMFSPFF